MVVNTNSTLPKRLPPYVSYRTFHNFIENLQVTGIPARIDRSYWEGKLSGSIGIQLTSALRFMGFIDATSVPTNRLKLLVSARGPQRAELLRQVSYEAYVFLFKGEFDLQNGTYAQLEELFHSQFELGADVARKCIKFFLELAGDAGIHLSPFITKKMKASRPGTGTKSSKKSAVRMARNAIIPNEVPEVPQVVSWEQMVLNKFPSFDPQWPTEVKLQWFESFKELLKMNLLQGKLPASDGQPASSIKPAV